MLLVKNGYGGKAERAEDDRGILMQFRKGVVVSLVTGLTIEVSLFIVRLSRFLRLMVQNLRHQANLSLSRLMRVTFSGLSR